MAETGKGRRRARAVTGPGTRWSYVSVWEPREVNGGEPKYSVSLIIPKEDTETVEAVRQAIAEAWQDGQGTLRGNGKAAPPLQSIRTPLRDGDAEKPDDPAYAGSWFLNANSRTRPGIVDGSRRPVADRARVYSGVYGRASLSFYAYNVSGNRGIACGLENLQLLRDGEPLGGRSSAEEDFAGYGDDGGIDEDFLL